MSKRAKTELRLPARFSITRSSGSDGDKARIAITDQISGIVILELTADLLEYGAASLGLSEQACEVRLAVSGNVGRKSEVKTELVEFEWAKAKKARGDDEDRRADPYVRKVLAKYEVDGWVAHVRDLFNGHNTVRGKAGAPDRQRVSFFRFVDATEEDIAAAREKNAERAALLRSR